MSNNASVNTETASAASVRTPAKALVANNARSSSKKLQSLVAEQASAHASSAQKFVLRPATVLSAAPVSATPAAKAPSEPAPSEIALSDPSPATIAAVSAVNPAVDTISQPEISPMEPALQNSSDAHLSSEEGTTHPTTAIPKSTLRKTNISKGETARSQPTPSPIDSGNSIASPTTVGAVEPSSKEGPALVRKTPSMSTAPTTVDKRAKLPRKSAPLPQDAQKAIVPKTPLEKSSNAAKELPQVSLTHSFIHSSL